MSQSCSRPSSARIRLAQQEGVQIVTSHLGRRVCLAVSYKSSLRAVWSSLIDFISSWLGLPRWISSWVSCEYHFQATGNLRHADSKRNSYPFSNYVSFPNPPNSHFHVAIIAHSQPFHKYVFPQSHSASNSHEARASARQHR